jgi:hypothetical protein
VNLPTIKDFPAIGFKIKGSLDQPSYHVDTKALGKLFLQQGGDIVKKVAKGIPGLDKLIPGLPANSDEPTQAANSNASKAAKPEKVVKNLIKGIFG